MSLPALWVDRIFAKLSVRYGVAFKRQYEDLDIAAVKEDWAEVLAGFDGDSLAYALRYLPTDKPPTAMQFRDICRRAPSPEAPRQLEGPKPDPARVAALMERMRKATALPHGIKFPQRAERQDAPADFGQFNPIPPELCPWNQPKEAANTDDKQRLELDPRFAGWAASVTVKDES